MGKLENKVAVITGGNSGIGLATAQEFLKEGAKVIITGRNEKSIQEAVASLGEGASGVIADVSKLEDLRELPQKISEKADKIDILFVNAGIAKFAPIGQVDEAFFDDQFDVNVKGAYFTIQHLLPLFNEKGGSIILNASISANIGMPNSSVYAATKAALISLGRTLSAELIERGIRVNTISPGPITTPIYGKLGLPEEQLNEMAGSMQNQVPMKRFGNPEEIAKVATFFASDDSSFVLGVELVADGGMSTL